jgi:hypothetical protein
MYQELEHETDTPDPPLRVPQVIARYYRGVGSHQDNGTLDRFWFGFSGKDEERIRCAALAGLYHDYRSEKDSIYIIGFSRGAASARLLARELCIKGLPRRLMATTTYFANRLTGQREPRITRVQRLGYDSEPHRVKVAFLGCWDTVDAFFLPNRYPKEGRWHRLMDATVRAAKSLVAPLINRERFQDDEKQIPPQIEKVVHCVAIDETRNEFLPTLMPYADNVEEVWFPGVHADVGGGYNEDDNLLAEEPYQFMKSRLIAAVKAQGGNAETLSETLFKSQKKKISYEYCFHFYGLNTGLFKDIKDWSGFGRDIRRIRVLDAPSNVKPKIHSSVENIRQSSFVFAADNDDKRMWRITYEPYNVRELRDRNNAQKPEDNFEYAYTDKKAPRQS